MKNLVPRSASVIGIACLLSLGTVACGNRADSSSDGATSAPSSQSTTSTAPTASTTAAPASSTTSTTKARTADDDKLTIFCTNAKPLGFTSLADIQPLDVAGARSLRAKLDLIEASAPADIAPTLVIIRKTTDPYLDEVEAGRIFDTDSVIAWATDFDLPTIDATVAAVPEMGQYVATNCP